MHKPATLHDIAAALAPHGATRIRFGYLYLNETCVAYRDGYRIVLHWMDRGQGNIMAAKTAAGDAETIAGDILWRVGECKAVAA